MPHKQDLHTFSNTTATVSSGWVTNTCRKVSRRCRECEKMGV